jgi:arylsulfatase A-like enzyme
MRTCSANRRSLSGSLISTGLLVCIASSIALVQQTSANADDRPNVVVIMTDDQRWDTLEVMPNVRDLLRRRGTLYRNAFVPNPLCCPSRVSTLTGLNSHVTGVYANRPPGGGFSMFDDRLSIATVLDAAGYRTLYVGKYMNGYPAGNYSYVPPGWDRWFSFATGEYYDYRAAEDGTRTRLYGWDPGDYSARVMTKKALSLIGSTRNPPFFLFFSATAPHGSTDGDDGSVNLPVPGPRDVGRFADIPAWRPSTFGARDDVSDMPLYLQGTTWNHEARDDVDLIRQRQLESLYSLDRQIGKLVRALPRDTLIIFLSDNGFLWGEHRWNSKFVPYEESIRIPMIVTWRGTVPHRVDRRLALNVDVVPTILAAAGLDPATPTGIDAATGGGVGPEGLDLLGPDRRDVFVLEAYNNDEGRVPGYCGLRTSDRWMYVRYWETDSPDNGFEDLYDVGNDPLQQDNLAVDADWDDKRRDLMALTKDLCRPVPPTYSWDG